MEWRQISSSHVMFAMKFQTTFKAEEGTLLVVIRNMISSVTLITAYLYFKPWQITWNIMNLLMVLHRSDTPRKIGRNLHLPGQTSFFNQRTRREERRRRGDKEWTESEEAVQSGLVSRFGKKKLGLILEKCLSEYDMEATYFDEGVGTAKRENLETKLLQILTAHQDNTDFVLSTCPTEVFVLSRGKDKSVVMWSIQDHISGTNASSAKSTGFKTKVTNDKSTESPSIGPLGFYQRHMNIVDVQFCPSSVPEFCSVSDDSCLILWDTCSGTSPTIKVSFSFLVGWQVEKAHKVELHCVDWNHHEILIVSGSADNTVCMLERRNLTSGGVGSPMYNFEGRTAAVFCVQCCPDKASAFGKDAEDGFLNVWDYEKVDKSHGADLHCVDWNLHDENLILIVSADNSVRMFDSRNLTSGIVGSPYYEFEEHKAAVLCIQCCPDKVDVFGSAAEDGFNVWYHEKVGKKKDHVGTRMPNSPPGLFLQHAGNRDEVVDFHWNTSDPWTMVNVSDDCESTGGGGTLQIFTGQ